MTDALNVISINEFLHFLSLVDHSDYWIIVSDRCIKKMIENGLKKGSIVQEDGIGKFYRADMPTGVPLIHKLPILSGYPIV